MTILWTTSVLCLSLGAACLAYYRARRRRWEKSALAFLLAIAVALSLTKLLQIAGVPHATEIIAVSIWVLLFAVVLMSVVVWWLPIRLAAVSRERTADHETPTLEMEFRKLSVEALGGAVLVIGLLVTWSELQESRSQHQENIKAVQAQLDLASRTDTASRFTSALESLGHEQLGVRVGAIFALEQIARDFPKSYLDPVSEVLISYVKGRATIEGYRATRERGIPERVLRDGGGSLWPEQDIIAALKVLGRSRHDENGVPWAKAIMYGIYLPDASVDIDLRGLSFPAATFSRAHIYYSDISDSAFIGADLSGASIQGSQAHRTLFLNADLTRANLSEADFAGANFRKAEMLGAILYGSDLSMAKGLTQEQIDMACIDDRTKLPQPLKREPSANHSYCSQGYGLMPANPSVQRTADASADLP